jgi:hypothetical protein
MDWKFGGPAMNAHALFRTAGVDSAQHLSISGPTDADELSRYGLGFGCRLALRANQYELEQRSCSRLHRNECVCVTGQAFAEA